MEFGSQNHRTKLRKEFFIFFSQRRCSVSGLFYLYELLLDVFHLTIQHNKPWSASGTLVYLWSERKQYCVLGSVQCLFFMFVEMYNAPSSLGPIWNTANHNFLGMWRSHCNCNNMLDYLYTQHHKSICMTCVSDEMFQSAVRSTYCNSANSDSKHKMLFSLMVWFVEANLCLFPEEEKKNDNDQTEQK